MKLATTNKSQCMTKTIAKKTKKKPFRRRARLLSLSRDFPIFDDPTFDDPKEESKIGAQDENRTRNIQLGRLTLYQLSYPRTGDITSASSEYCRPLLEQKEHQMPNYAALPPIFSHRF